MIDIIFDILGVVCLSLSNIFVWSILLNKKLDFKNYKIFITVVSLSFISLVIYGTVQKFTLTTALMIFLIRFLFGTNIKESIITSIFVQTINVISEFIFSIILIFILGVKFDPMNITSLITLFADVFVGSCCILIAKLNLVSKLYNSIIRITNKSKMKYLLIGLIPIIFIFNAYIQLTYYKMDSFYIFFLNNISIYLVVTIILILVKRENDYIKIYNKYNTTLNSLKEYEDILDKYRVSNHENKNQLLTIRNMIPVRNKKIISYIDEIVENKLRDDEKIMHEVSIIPAGGIRGLIYSKILYMKENNIEYELNISKEIRTVDLINKLNDSDILDICQIIGVYIDNAIEAVLNIKDKYVNIEMYLEENNLVFEISNYYEGNIEINKIDQKGYTTKGKGHGYGLSLTKQIIKNNKKLSNNKMITNETFSQMLKIKM